MQLYSLTAHELIDKLKKKEIKVSEITDSIFNRIRKVEEKIKGYITITEDIAKNTAKQVDNQPGQYLAIPIAIKDNICTKGIRTTCASKILSNFIPPYNATVVEKINSYFMPLIGKTNMDEFGMGSTTENSSFFVTKNPYQLEAVPGGSSGGSSAAVSADLCIWALGTDTGGSIRQPAAFCGVVGLKPTYGRVSRYGLIAYASSLDQIGPITKDVKDCAILLNIISGFDELDSTSVNTNVPDYTKALIEDVKEVKIGIPKELMGEGIDEDIRKSIKKAVEVLCGLGATYQEVSLPHIEYCVPTYYILAPAEASSNLARYDGVRYGMRVDGNDIIEIYKNTREVGFGEEVKRRIMLGTYVLSAGYYDAYYLKAQKVRTLIKHDFDKAFRSVDVLIAPCSPTVAFKLGEKLADPLKMYISDICTIPVNLAGLPAISIPCGFKDGLPIGMQIIGKPFAEDMILRVAYTYERNTNWHKIKPKID